MKKLCRWCGKPTKTYYVIADDMENPKPYHKKCVDELFEEALLLSDIKETNKIIK